MRISDWSSDVCSSDLAEAAPARDIPLDAMIEKEPVTVILSKRGWIRAQRGHVAADQWGEFKFKDGDELLFAAHAQTPDKALISEGAKERRQGNKSVSTCTSRGGTSPTKKKKKK